MAGPKTHTRSDHCGGAELFGERQRQVGDGDAVRERPVEPDTDELRLRKDVRLAQHDRLDLDPPDPPPQHPRAFTIGVCESPGNREIRKCDRRRPRPIDECDGGDLFQVDLMDNTGVGWKYRQAIERLLGPFEKPIALAVALEFALEIDRFGIA